MRLDEIIADLAEPTSIGDRIKTARKKLTISQVGLAKRVGVTQPAVANWESGVHDPRRLMLAKIAEALQVSPEWLASGARSTKEADKHPAAAYIRRPLQHTPVISFEDAASFYGAPTIDPHTMAEDYIPVTSGAEKIFALFVDDEAIDLAFPKDTLVVIDYEDRSPADGAFVLVIFDASPIIRRWREDPPRLEPASSNPAYGPIYVDAPLKIIGCVRVSIRFH